MFIINNETTMLSLFKIQNFKSIIKETVSLKFGEGKAPNGYKGSAIMPFIEAGGIRAVPCLMFFGANASGKSNLLEAFYTFRRAVIHGIDNCFVPNKINRKFDSTAFDIEFFVSKNKYNYVLEYDEERIIKEALIKNDEFLYEITEKKNNFHKIEAKGYTAVQNFCPLLEVECSIQKDGKFFQRQTFLTKAFAPNGKYPGLNEYLSEAYDYISSKLEVYSHNNINSSFAINRLAGEDTESAIRNSFDRIIELLKKLDIDIADADLIRNVVEHNRTDKGQVKLRHVGNSFLTVDSDKIIIVSDNIITKHKDIDNNLVPFKFSEESMGTQVLFGLLGICLSALDKGITLIIDEIDRSLHPILFKQIIKLFKDKRYNKHNAQLIFSTHNSDVLDDDIVRVSEVGIVSKTLKAGTTLVRLCDFEDLRNVNNFRKQYLEGRFSGIPFPYV